MQTFDCPHCHRVFESNPGEDEVVPCPHCNSTVALPEEDLPPGTMVEGFEIIRLLGHGGMGNVYMANQVSMNRPVALKILLKSMTEDKESVRQFLNEVRVSGRLNHRNIITAIDAGEIDDTYFLVTAFVDGLDLEKIIEEEGIISEKQSLRIAIKIADALQYSWESHGMLHKDIKPGNLILDSNGECFLMDMGIAQFIGDAPKEEEHILGSPFFMSPEQTRGERLSWSSDLYSLGATIYNMIVGVPPYDADDVMKIVEMHSNEPFPLPSIRNPEAKVSKQTVMLMKKMMAKMPSERFDSWGGFKEAATKTLKALNAPSGQTKKRKAPSKKKPVIRRRIVQQKSGGGGLAMIVISLTVLAIAIGSAYFYFNKNKTDNARAYLARAENFLMNHPGDYLSSIERFRLAAKKAKGTSIESRAMERLKAISKEWQKQEKLNDAYREAKKKAIELIKQKRYKEAIVILEKAIKEVKNPGLVKDAEMYIKQLKKTQKLNRNIF